MSKKLFTDEQIQALNASPYVERVTAKTISFTQEFKRMAYNEMVAGKPMWQILRDHCIDTEALGAVRVMKFQQYLGQCAKREEGFKNMRNVWRSKPEQRKEDDLLYERFKKMENEVAYLKQVVEFLKKIQMADMEAKNAWESKHRQK